MKTLASCLKDMHPIMKKIVYLEENGFKFYENKFDNSSGWSNGIIKIQFEKLDNHSLESLEKLVVKI